jgi:hypothetical protein
MRRSKMKCEQEKKVGPNGERWRPIGKRKFKDGVCYVTGIRGEDMDGIIADSRIFDGEWMPVDWWAGATPPTHVLCIGRNVVVVP